MIRLFAFTFNVILYSLQRRLVLATGNSEHLHHLDAVLGRIPAKVIVEDPNSLLCVGLYLLDFRQPVFKISSTVRAQQPSLTENIAHK